MAHFQIREYESLEDARAQAVYDEIISDLGFGMVPNLFKSMAGRVEFLETQWLHFKSTILQGYLPRTLKEMIGVAISQHNNSEYALKVHLHGLSALGMSEEVLQTLISDFEACPLPEREKEVIRFGLMAGTCPGELRAEHYARLREQGLSEDEIFEIIATANLFVGVNQYTDSIKLEIDQL